MKDFLGRKILDNPTENWIWFFAIILVAIILRRYLSQLISSILYTFFKRYTNQSQIKKFNTLLIKPTSTFVVLCTIFFAFQLLKYPAQWKITWMGYELRVILIKAMAIMLTISFTWMCLKMADFISFLMRGRVTGKNRMEDQLIPFVKDIFKVLINIVCFFFILGFIFKVNVASLIAGLGIGGIAIALAAQDTLANLFASLTIFLDRPFRVGDMVKVGPISGTVERIGFRSTRIRTVDKTFVAVPNKKMTDDYLDNLSLRTYRRVYMNLQLSLHTDPVQLRKVIEEIQQLYKSKPQLNEENHVTFENIGEHAVQVLVEYFVPTMSYTDFLKLKEEINFSIMEIIKRNGCEFAKIMING